MWTTSAIWGDPGDLGGGWEQSAHWGIPLMCIVDPGDPGGGWEQSARSSLRG
ncbi:hypothetical protein FA95DRAFT_1560199 [Auriscalpium vulgare]|uniref:Uncharacterized protein n=1 Tax=Auriscalpium vulgare TaxID=40419 RepID=A0ACB8RPY9_9AGAM|nr:hypothetical protein FA95DRAFT_1560199 [Auriscalpium vulgare]